MSSERDEKELGFGVSEASLPPMPPEILSRGVGVGDFWRVGCQTTALIVELCGPLDGASVLDIGCGLGRVAFFLERVIGGEGRYLGFDTHSMYIDWCRDYLGLEPPRCRFEHFDLRSSTYNPGGAFDAAELEFPWPEQSFDLAVATSLFTHLQADGAANYARQAFRMLRPGGQLFATFFVLSPETVQEMDRGSYGLRFSHRTPQGRMLSLDDPEGGVAFFESWLEDLLLREIGYQLDHYVRGLWRQGDERYYQDVVVLRRPLSAAAS